MTKAFVYRWIAAGFALGCCSSLFAESLEEQLQACRSIQDSELRLACFDNLQFGGFDTVAETPQEEECRDCQSLLKDEENEIAVQERRKREARNLSANNPNYFVWASPSHNELQDDAHAEFYLSTKYPLYYVEDWKLSASDTTEPENYWITRFPNRVFLIYNGLYDFYVSGDRYESSPVISRQQNVGLQAEWQSVNRLEKLRVGWMHESNGQVLGDDESDLFFERRAQFGDDFALAEVSRGWDYFQVRYEKSSDEDTSEYNESWWRYNFEVRSYLCDCQALFFKDSEDDIWWEPGDDASIADYDGLRFTGETNFKVIENYVLVRTELKAGLHDPSNFGGKLTLGYKLGNLRLTAFYFNGYGKEPATYHLRTKYFGIGLELR